MKVQIILTEEDTPLIVEVWTDQSVEGRAHILRHVGDGCGAYVEVGKYLVIREVPELH